ncbi:MAG TPA: alpha/beta fold hydrolase [Gemmatimonadales bacterium]|nr:alpha/beta fold hydrolase [Gemmatimonadales bacterium]
MATAKQRAFRLTGADGGPLRGDVRTAGEDRPAVVICHGFKGFKNWGFFPVIAEQLARAGFTAVSFNFSGSGVGEDGETFSEPERFAHVTYSAEVRDLDRIITALADGSVGLAPTAIGVLGHSMGGGVAVLQAAGDQRVGALVTWAATARFGRLWQPEQVPEWRRTGTLEVMNQRTGEILPLSTDILDDWERNAARLDVSRAAGLVRGPWLIAHGSADESVPVDDARALHEANPRSELLLLDDAGHTFGIKHPWGGSSKAFDRLYQATVAWFARHLLP